MYFCTIMKKILKVDSPNDYARYVGAPELHPLLSIIHYDELPPVRHSLNNYGVYGLFVQRAFPESLFYGTKNYDTSDASIIAVAPGQIGGAEENGQVLSLSGWVLLWSPDFLHNTELEPKMREYEYFSYFASESLRMNPSEWNRITWLIEQMRMELQENTDTPALRKVLLGYIHLVLEYCNRIYLRQLSLENKDTDDILNRFHALLDHYFREGKQLQKGLPTVAYCASELAYSSRYFGDLVHKATGGTAIGYIHAYVIKQAKSLLMNGHNVSETSTLLGFEYPHHFTRLFKRMVGMTPTEFLKK